MGRYFGTDGVRGVANSELDALLAFKIGAAAAYALTQESAHGRKAKLLIGKDTRVSSDMLENALVAGICSVGADVELLGVIPTPAVAFLTIKHKADAGIVISASHNSFEYNGIKIFAGNGYKLPDETEARIEDLIDDFESIPKMTHEKIGRVLKSEIDPVVEYTDHLADTIKGDLSGLRVAVDCANGSSSTTVERLMRLVECKAEIRFYEPDGININDNCGSTHDSHKRQQLHHGSGQRCRPCLSFHADGSRRHHVCRRHSHRKYQHHARQPDIQPCVDPTPTEHFSIGRTVQHQAAGCVQ